MSSISDPRKRRSAMPALAPVQASEPTSFKEASGSSVSALQEEVQTVKPEPRLTRLFVPTVKVRAPDPNQDFGTYRAFDEMLKGVREICEARRRGLGAVGYAAVNAMSDLQKAAVDAITERNYAYAADLLAQADRLESDFKRVRLPEELARFLPEGYDTVIPRTNQFLNTMGQERKEGNLYMLVWPVIIGESEVVPVLPSLRESNTDIPQVMSGIVDLVSELSKGVDKETSQRSQSTVERLRITDRFLLVASSIELRLSQERHHPGNVIDNGWGHWNRFSTRIRKQVQAVIAFKMRDKALYLSNLEVQESIRALREDLKAASRL